MIPGGIIAVTDQHSVTPGSADDPFRDIHGLANTLRQWRSAVRWSQEELWRRCGVSEKTINDIENGKVPNPQDRTLKALATAFSEETGVGYDSLLADLKSARAHKPGQQASAFALRIDGLLQGLEPGFRVFMEDALTDFFHALMRANRHAREVQKSLKKKGG
jgi:transcriptional regulator with XRE-family HTH domain